MHKNKQRTRNIINTTMNPNPNNLSYVSAENESDAWSSPRWKEREDSGYSSDVNRSPAMSDADQENSTSDSGERYDSSEEDDEDLESSIAYLNKKQTILKRAAEVLSREENYDAATCALTASQPPYSPSSTVKEAMEMLTTLGHVSTESDTPRSRQPERRKRKNPSHPAIDISTVQRLPASKFARLGTVTTKDENILALLGSIPLPVFDKGQWMAKALVWSAPLQHQDLEHAFDCSWKVVSSPSTYALGLVPPHGMSMKNAVDIQEAISITNEARVVTQATPPFSIVFANKAFLTMAGFLPTDTTTIGQPVESILQISQEIIGSETCREGKETANYLDGSLRLVDDDMACRIRISPVVDRIRSEHSCVSHILVQVSEVPSMTS
jgi:hypothetical protein